MKKLSLLLLSLALVFLLIGNANAASLPPFETPLTITKMVEHKESNHFYYPKDRGSYKVKGNTASVEVNLLNDDVFDGSGGGSAVGVRLGPDTGGDWGNFRNLWDLTGYDGECIQDVQIEVTVNYSYFIQSPDAGHIGLEIQIGNDWPFFQLAPLNNESISDTDVIETETISFGELFVAGGLDVTGPHFADHGDLNYNGWMTIHSVHFAFPGGEDCSTDPDVMGNITVKGFDTLEVQLNQKGFPTQTTSTVDGNFTFEVLLDPGQPFDISIQSP